MIDEINAKAFLSGSGGGGKGGGGGGDTPEEQDDTLQSSSVGKIVLAVCEGPIEGFVEDGNLKNVYLNDVVVETPSGGFNFSKDDFSVSNITRGINNQDVLDGYDDIEIEQSVDAKVTKEAGQTSVGTTRDDLRSVRVRVGVSALYQIDDESGDITGTNVEYRIKIKDSFSQSNIINSTFTIDGKSRGPFEREHSFALTGGGPWMITVKRESDDSDRTTLVNDLFFKAIVGEVGSRFTYPNTAVLGLTFNAEAFSSIPRVSLMIDGKRIRVPSNYNAADVDSSFTGAYSGTWDGSLILQYSNNPAWVFYDLLVNDRYGCGDFMRSSDIDKFALYEIAKYCDEPVDDGQGGQERRFVFNGHINNRGEAFDVLNSIAATFRGMLYYHQGTVVAVQDAPATTCKIFSPSNVIQEVDDSGGVTSPGFNYEGTALKTRKTVCLVSWNDPADLYKTKVEYVEDSFGVNRYGHREIEIRAFGCTSQAQAQRLGRWNLLTSLTETETVAFKVAAEGFFLLPGEIIEIADPNRQSNVAAGFLRDITLKDDFVFYLDRNVQLAAGELYNLSVVINNEIKTSIVTTLAGLHQNLTVSSNRSARARQGDMWFLKANDSERKRYRVIGVQEDDDGTVAVMAVSHNAAKYDDIDSATLIQRQRPASVNTNLLPTVSPESIQVGFTD
jgi:predicted phage tail protein